MHMTQDELLALVTHGGGTLVFIALASVIALALAIERFVAMRRVVPEAKTLHDAVSKSLLKGDVDEARQTAARSQALVADIYLAGFSRWQHKGGKGFEDAVDRQRLAQVLALKKRLWAIGTVGTIAPFIGLFGTVVGIMSAFSSMAETGTGGFAVVASGISQALIATASGIAVAIEAVVFFNFLQTKLSAIAAELKLLSEEFCELLADVSEAKGCGAFTSASVPPASPAAPASNAPDATPTPSDPSSERQDSTSPTEVR